MPTTEKAWDYPRLGCQQIINESLAYIQSLPISANDKSVLNSALQVTYNYLWMHTLGFHKDKPYTITIEQTSGGFVSGKGVVFVREWYRNANNVSKNDNMQFPTEIATQIINKVNPSPKIRILTKAGDDVVRERLVLETRPPQPDQNY